MKRTDPKQSQEPVGIVISGMPPAVQTTVFTAYVWGPAPADSSEKKAS